MNFTPGINKVLLKKINEEKSRPSGLILKETEEKKSITAIVISIGVLTEKDVIELKINDKTLISLLIFCNF